MNTRKKNIEQDLCKAFLCLRNIPEVKNFLNDLLTKTETEEFARRLEVAKMLTEEISYVEIEKRTNMSSTTIARISKFLKGPAMGYKTILGRLKKHHHTPTVSPVCFNT